MRSLICLFAILFCNVTLAQDPTVPSAQILARLKPEQSTPVTAARSPDQPIQESSMPPVLKLKAIVMADPDHGTALIEVDGRRLRLSLTRPATETLGASISVPPISQDSVVIKGLSYHVQAFSARSVTLSNNGQTLIVQ